MIQINIKHMEIILIKHSKITDTNMKKFTFLQNTTWIFIFTYYPLYMLSVKFSYINIKVSRICKDPC